MAFGVVGCVPDERLRRWMNDTVSLIGFRIIARSLSAVINFHNEEYRPKNCGFCVANHTSPIDVTMLSSDCTFSLVRKRHIVAWACTLYGTLHVGCATFKSRLRRDLHSHLHLMLSSTIITVSLNVSPSPYLLLISTQWRPHRFIGLVSARL